jgi:hypothetical protein
MKMPPAFSFCMLDHTVAIGGYYENGSGIFMLYACVTKGILSFFLIVAEMHLSPIKDPL